MMRDDADSTNGEQRKDSDRTRRYTVPEAAGVIGISSEAVRQRIKRGTLPTQKDTGGTVYVLLSEEIAGDRTRQDADGTRKDGDLTSDSTAFIERMAAEIEYLRGTVARRDEEIRRRDHLLAAATVRIPALEESSEARGSSVTVSGNSAKGVRSGDPEQPEPTQRRSWWREFFGLE